MPKHNSKTKRKALMLGIGLDSDGHKRLTRGDNFALVGGSEETHEQMTEKAIKINEKLKSRGVAPKPIMPAKANGRIFPNTAVSHRLRISGAAPVAVSVS